MWNKFGLSSEALKEAERTIIHPDTYVEIKISEVSEEVAKRAEELLYLDKAFEYLERSLALKKFP